MNATLGTRKLACTKEPDGCSRCKREGITCHYSPQKPMGRPRKRLRDGNPTDCTPADQGTSNEPVVKNPMTEVPPDVFDPGMGLIDMLLNEETLLDMSGSFDFIGMSSQSQEPGISFAAVPAKGPVAPYQFPLDGNVGNLDFGIPNHDHNFSTSDLDPSFFIDDITDPALLSEQVPALSPNTSKSASTPDSPALTSQHTALACGRSDLKKCACSANLYLALASLQNLETDITRGVRQARLAAKTAYETVNCPICSGRVDDIPQITPESAMQSFQNMMLLATLIPSLVHAYSEILRSVDMEAQKARAERRQLVFMLDGLGGLWGGLSEERGCLVETQSFKHREMDPTLWRLTVRALLRIDVYGLSTNIMDLSSPAGGEPFHLGLKDIVNLMDAKSKARHAYMDAMVANGIALPLCNSGPFKLHQPGEIPTCQTVIQIARNSIDNIVIA